MKQAFLRSDEAGCYHNSNLIAAAKDVGDRLGTAVVRYDFSEPQQGKGICDRVLCLMEASIRYCVDGHDILNVRHMSETLKERPVRGTMAAVGILNHSCKHLQIHKMKHFSGLRNNFCYEESGLRV